MNINLNTKHTLNTILALAIGICFIPLSRTTGQPLVLNLPLTVLETAGMARAGEPVTSGVPIPRDLGLTNLSTLRLLDGSGRPVAAQFTALARWGGGPDDASKPVRWLLLDFQADAPARSTVTYHLVNTNGAQPAFPRLVVSDARSAVGIDTGVAQFSISKIDGQLRGPNLAEPLYGRALDPDGRAYITTGPVTVTVALSGPMRASIHVKGTYRDAGGQARLNYTDRYWFYAGQPTVRLFHTIENNTPCPLDDTGQPTCYDIGSSGSVTVADVSLVLPTNLGSNLTYQAAGEGPPISGRLTGNFLLYQDSSGTDRWNRYPTMTDWDGNRLDARPRMQAHVRFCGYRTTLAGAVVDSGNHAAGWLTVVGNGGAWTVGVRDFWRNFPKALRAAANGTLQIGLFPGEFDPPDYAFTLRAGEHKTHEVWLAPSSRLPVFSSPLWAQAPAQWVVDSGAFGLTAFRNLTVWPEHERYIDDQLTTSPDKEQGWEEYFDNLLDAIELRDTYEAQRSFLTYTNWLRTYAWIALTLIETGPRAAYLGARHQCVRSQPLTPIETGPRAAYPYEWWFDARTGIPGDDNDNKDPSINNWLLLGADAMAYAHRLSGEADYLERAARLFRTGSRDPWFEGDPSIYSESKQAINSVTFGHIFLHEWARRTP